MSCDLRQDGMDADNMRAVEAIMVGLYYLHALCNWPECSSVELRVCYVCSVVWCDVTVAACSYWSTRETLAGDQLRKRGRMALHVSDSS